MKTLVDWRDTIGKHHLIRYGALLLLVGGSSFFVQPAYWGLQPPHLNTLVTMISALFVIIPLAWRRSFLITALVFVASTLVLPDMFNTMSRVNLSSIASIMAIYSKTAYGGRRRNLICFASIVAFNGGLVYRLITSSNALFLSSVTLFNLTGLLWNLLTFSAIWWFGNTMRVSRERTSLLSAGNRVVRGNQKNARWAAFYELGHIAQRVCGILAYNIRVMGTQARAARQVLRQYPKKALNSLNRIKQSIRYVGVGARRIFDALWDEQQSEPCTAQSGLCELEKLAKDVQVSGLQLKVEVEGEKREIIQTT